jgi:hypothetical protein
VKNLPAEVDDKRRRLIAFVVITLVFGVSVASLLYWAINVAATRINSRITSHLQAFNPLAVAAGVRAMLPSGTRAEPVNCVTACQVF